MQAGRVCCLLPPLLNEISTSFLIRRLVIALAAMVSALPVLRADWRAEIGHTRLQTLAGAELPTGAGAGLAQVEALESGANYAPDTALAEFAGKSFTLQSGPSAVSGHATHVARNFFSFGPSLLPGDAAVDLYSASDWLGAGFLKYGGDDLPDIESRAVHNHSWIGSTEEPEINMRLDYAINRDGFICVVGENNGASTTLPALMGQAYHTIAVGRDDGQHSAGFTTIDGTGRVKPDIVAPSAYPENATSWTTPMVAGAAGVLRGKLAAAPYSVSGADLPRAVKALLLAGATKDTVSGWDNTATRPLDEVYGAGELNLLHSYLALQFHQDVVFHHPARCAGHAVLRRTDLAPGGEHQRQILHPHMEREPAESRLAAAPGEWLHRGQPDCGQCQHGGQRGACLSEQSAVRHIRIGRAEPCRHLHAGGAGVAQPSRRERGGHRRRGP